MGALRQSAWKALLLPNGLLLALAAVLLHSGWLNPILPVIGYLNYAILIVGLLLAWRFHSSRAFFATLVLLLAEQALSYFTAGRIPLPGPGHAAFEAVGLLLPLNFILISLVSDSGLTLSRMIPLSLSLFIQVVGVAVFCRDTSPAAARALHHAVSPPPLPEYTWIVFATATALLLIRFFWFRKPLENALLWSMAGFFLALHFGGVGRTASVYLAASAITLSVSVIETSYLLAYHDELTSLPSRRAFNDALAHLHAPYSIAMVDIDHFKRFNDTYGHDAGDQVLQLVASRLANVTGGGKAFRCGGEEFAIVFAGQTGGEVLDHLEPLRIRIEESAFRMRSRPERRSTPRGPDRRTRRGRGRTGDAIRRLTKVQTDAGISVTVSIGVAAAVDENSQPEVVIQAADKALYRAKSLGRNRVEAASALRRPVRARSAGIA